MEKSGHATITNCVVHVFERTVQEQAQVKVKTQCTFPIKLNGAGLEKRVTLGAESQELRGTKFRRAARVHEIAPPILTSWLSER